MSFNWLNKFQQEMKKPPDYAEKTLAAYKLGMKAKGSIAGVQIRIDPHGCEPCRKLVSGAIYDPDEAPRLPLPGCDRDAHCQCVYRPIMSYQIQDET